MHINKELKGIKEGCKDNWKSIWGRERKELKKELLEHALCSLGRGEKGDVRSGSFSTLRLLLL